MVPDDYFRVRRKWKLGAVIAPAAGRIRCRDQMRLKRENSHEPGLTEGKAANALQERWVARAHRMAAGKWSEVWRSKIAPTEHCRHRSHGADLEVAARSIMGKGEGLQCLP